MDIYWLSFVVVLELKNNMKKNLTKIKNELYYFKDNRKMIVDKNDSKTFPPGIYGDVSGIRGNVFGIRGDVSDIFGDVSDIIGDVDTCEITTKERYKGIDIEDLIK